jgi:UMF1 family MFS transporter
MNSEPRSYSRRVWAWTMYDWANSAFATTILAAVLPVYYSQVAASTLANPAQATAYWSTGLSVSLVLVALLSPVLGTVSDITRGKKTFLSLFAGLGIVGTGLLVLVKSGDWLLASLLFVLGRVGFASANVFYDSLLPHVAAPEDQDRVSTRGFAMGYLGGGLLLAVNVLMIQFIPGTLGPRLCFLSVALWWALFSIPILVSVPEPRTLTARLSSGQSVLSVSFGRLWSTLKDIKQYRELFKFMLAVLIYADGIGTIIGVAAIYGAELGFGSLELILALLLVQFVGIPFSIIFGRLPGSKTRNRPVVLAFVVFNMLLLPVLGVLGSRLLPPAVSGGPPLHRGNLPLIFGSLLAVQVFCLALAFLLGKPLFKGLAERMDTKRSLFLALLVYAVVTVWGFFLSSVIEFWFLAWLVAVVQGGSQALSRSLFSSMIPAPKSGEFFGLYGIMEKVATIFGPLVFAAAATLSGSSRPAVLSLIVFFIAGMILLSRVDVAAGRRAAREEEDRLAGQLQ